MRILLYRADGQTGPWVTDFAQVLPHADVVVWQEGAREAPCDYAVLWAPPAALLGQLAHVKAIFLAGAGVDAILKFGDALPSVPIVRLGDAGMAVQMAEYVAHAVLRYFRRFDDYEKQARRGIWAPLPQFETELGHRIITPVIGHAAIAASMCLGTSAASSKASHATRPRSKSP